ncbi:MAG: hypothetical protein HYR66_16915 [Sphingobacteriales bacterium]|nr:hypothetical protein [Sphingobacteriales bacterium]MBI3719276.1 hypothetical protein [Sphingobacteriales bacterium]
MYRKNIKPVTDKELTSVKALLQELKDKLAFTINLTPEERKQLYKVDERRVSFVENACREMENNSSILPGFFDVQSAKDDLKLYQQLKEIEVLLEQLLDKVYDTRVQAGHHAMQASRLFYNSVQQAKASGVSGADSLHQLLKQHYNVGRPAGSANKKKTSKENSIT